MSIVLFALLMTIVCLLFAASFAVGWIDYPKVAILLNGITYLFFLFVLVWYFI